MTAVAANPGSSPLQEGHAAASAPEAELEPVSIIAWGVVSACGESSSSAPNAAVFPSQAGPILLGEAGPQGPLPNRTAALLGRAVRLVKGPVQEMISQLGAERIGLVLGSSTGGIDRTEKAVSYAQTHGALPEDYSFALSHAHHTLLLFLRESLGILGPAYVVSAACASSPKAIAAAQRLIHCGECDAVLTGGADALCELTQSGFSSLGLVSPSGCQPFSEGRKGLGLGEGSALLVVSRATPGTVQLLGSGESNDAFDLTAPHPLGIGAELAIRRALESAGLEANEVDYINAHGTGTVKNDGLESSVILRVFGPSARYSSTKDRVQHQLGTAGATEAIVCVDAIATGTWPLNLSHPPPDSSLALAPLIETPKGPGPRVALSNSFAFGGANVCLAFGRSRDRLAVAPKKRRIFLMSHSYWLGRFPGELAPATLLPTRMRGRSSPLSRIAAELFGTLEQALGPAARPLDRTKSALILGSAYGEMATSLELLGELSRRERPSPLRFQASVHNTALGLLTQVLENRSYATAIAAGASSFAMSLLDACCYLRTRGGDAVVLAADEAGPPLLLAGKTFPALGVGLVLRADEAPPPGALAELLAFAKIDSNDFRALTRLAAELPVELGPLAEAPESSALELLGWLGDSSGSATNLVGIGPGFGALFERL
jgi:3-oxoacyl-[acyl-carrier-protein] synthase I